MKFLSSDECKTLFTGREIYVFGAGAFGEIFHKKLGDVITVCAFIDNHRSGKGNYLCGKEIISLEQYKIRRTKEQPIIVSAYRHAVDISNQLENEGLVAGKDFFIWDNMCIFHADEITKRYISFMSDIWKDKKRQSDRIILIPFDSHHDQLTVLNVLSQKNSKKSQKKYCVLYGKTYIHGKIIKILLCMEFVLELQLLGIFYVKTYRIMI